MAKSSIYGWENMHLPREASEMLLNHYLIYHVFLKNLLQIYSSDH